MPDNRYTLLIIPEASQKVRRLTLCRSWLTAGVTLSLLLGVLAGGLVYDYFGLLDSRSELRRLRKVALMRDDRLQEALSGLEDLRRQLVLLGHNDAKLRVVTQLDPPRTEGLGGIGGAQEELPTDLADLQYQIDQLRASIDLQRTSQEEIHGILGDQQSLLAATPSGWPTRGWVTSRFGSRKDPFNGQKKLHHGFDIAARTGTPVLATADGVVSRIENLPGYGKTVVLDHGYGYQTRYAHNSRIFVKSGERVQRNQKIAAVGNTGRSTGSHLHYEVLVDGLPTNPKNYL